MEKTNSIHSVFIAFGKIDLPKQHFFSPWARSSDWIERCPCKVWNVQTSSEAEASGSNPDGSTSVEPTVPGTVSSRYRRISVDKNQSFMFI
jgi:hypothetical protein